MGPQTLARDEATEQEFVDELKPGTRLLQGQYTVTRFLNSGGFGITYVAKDSLGREVVIKECFPGAFCQRSKAIVAARSPAHQAEFKSIVNLFVQEAHNLSKLVHPNIVGVHQVFEDNDTAYMAIDYIKGSDLLDMIEDKSITLAPSNIVAMTHKLLNAVAFIHSNGILHRDISPDNILINEKAEPILIDFGAARQEASRASRALSALRVVKDGYSPQELYIAGSEQGPWSDLYALGASMYHAITGEPPTNSQARLAAIVEGKDDPQVRLAGRFPHYPDGFLEAIDMAMSTLPRKRIQSANDWLAMLEKRPVQTNTENIDSLVMAMVAADQASKAEEAQAKVAEQLGKAQDVAVPPSVVGTAAVGTAAVGTAAVTLAPDYRAKPNRGLWFGFAAVLVLGLGGFFYMSTASGNGALQISAPAPQAVAPVNLVNLAIWDVDLPFKTTEGVDGDAAFATITDIRKEADLTLYGTWIRKGVEIHAINDDPVTKGQSAAALILKAFKLDPDGLVRAAVLIRKPSGSAKKRVELALPAIRRIGLFGMVGLESRIVDGEWETVVTGLQEGSASPLQIGDILLGEAQSKSRFNTAKALEENMESLGAKGITKIVFDVERAGTTMQVTVDAGVQG